MLLLLVDADGAYRRVQVCYETREPANLLGALAGSCDPHPPFGAAHTLRQARASRERIREKQLYNSAEVRRITTPFVGLKRKLIQLPRIKEAVAVLCTVDVFASSHRAENCSFIVVTTVPVL